MPPTISYRRRKERKTIGIYLNNNRLEQVDKLKYHGIIIESKFKFNEHVKYITNRCTKLINALSKSARISWGLNHEALKILYTGAILPQLLYAVPVWIDSMKKEYNRKKYVRVQTVICLRIAKACCTVSHEALCIIRGIPPIIIKAEEAAALYNITIGRNIHKYQIDKEENPRLWLHPARTVKVSDNTDETTDGREDRKHIIHVYTDGSKREHGVGSGVVIFKDDEITDTKNYKLDGRCSNNHVEQLAILRALENIQNMDTNDKIVQIHRQPNNIGISQKQEES
jgi:hypothetical protein